LSLASDRRLIRDTFGDCASHRVIVKTYSVTHLVKEAQGRTRPPPYPPIGTDGTIARPPLDVIGKHLAVQRLLGRMVTKE
jgi:hypothetical protein